MFSTHSARRAFTLVELITVISIIALLATLLVPVITSVMEKSDSTKCIANLRQIGMAVNACAIDNENRFPMVETDPENPVHAEEDGAKPLADVLAPYQVGPETLRCPADMKAKLNYPKDGGSSKSFFEAKRTSYEWRPMFDGELVNAARIITPRGAFTVPQSRVRLLLDYVNAGEAPHERTTLSSSYNCLYADGSVRTLTINKADKDQPR
jgi:prepilin-type N-terminal cleavage/methylation domain-containing protein/prepilin-type processing-associated H-X9-DG protein